MPRSVDRSSPIPETDLRPSTPAGSVSVQELKDSPSTRLLLRDRSDADLERLASDLNEVQGDPTSADGVQDLQQALEAGDYARPIFADPIAPYYNMLLLLGGKITVQQFATIQEYLSLKADEAKGVISDVVVKKITDPKVRAQIGRCFWSGFDGVQIQRGIAETIREESPSEQVIFVFNIVKQDQDMEWWRMLGEIASGFFLFHEVSEDVAHDSLSREYIKGSASLNEHLFHEIYGEHAQKPRYAVGDSTLEDVLRDAEEDLRVEQRPFPGFALPSTADGAACLTGEEFMTHDLFHRAVASSVSAEARLTAAEITRFVHTHDAGERLVGNLVDMLFTHGLLAYASPSDLEQAGYHPGDSFLIYLDSSFGGRGIDPAKREALLDGVSQILAKHHQDLRSDTYTPQSGFVRRLQKKLAAKEPRL
ncbi:MAG: hypothetical protein ACOYKZ_05405 [Chlamydiia bacterium]